MGKEENNNEETDRDTVTLYLDNDQKVTCGIVAIFPAGDNDYIALLPLDDNQEPVSDEVYLYRYIEHEDGVEPDLENITSDDEFELVGEAFDEYLDAMEYEDECEDDEE